MRSLLTTAITLALGAGLLSGCTQSQPSLALPKVNPLVTQGVYIKDLADLDRQSTAVAVVQPTGKSWIEYVDAQKGVPPTPFPVVELRVVKEVKGELPEFVNLRQGYTYEGGAGEAVPVVSGPGQFLLYLVHFDWGDGTPWNGQWVTQGYLSGVYMDLGSSSGKYTRVDPEARTLPETLTAAEAADPESVGTVDDDGESAP